MARSRYDELHDRYGAILTAKAGTRYERLTAMVFKTLSEQDVVVHDISLVGNSEVSHQIDVRVGSDSEERRILIECKDYDISGNKVGLDIVRNFFAVLEDTGVKEGFIITTGSFTADAAKYAKAKNIKLVLLRIHQEDDWNGFVKNFVVQLKFLSLPQTAPATLHISDETEIMRFQDELAAIGITGGIAIGDPVYFVRDQEKHEFNEFISRKMLAAIPLTDTPDQMKLRIENDGYTMQIDQGKPIRFNFIETIYEVMKEDREISITSDRVAELIIKGFGNEDIVIYGDELEKRQIDAETGEVI